jgi:hypothetical protein
MRTRHRLVPSRFARGQKWARIGSREGRKKKIERLADYCDFSCKKVFFLQTNILCFKFGFFDIGIHKSIIL